jgi:hypothetical protein
MSTPGDKPGILNSNKGGGRVKKMAHGGKVTRSIDGRAKTGLTRGSRRT